MLKAPLTMLFMGTYISIMVISCDYQKDIPPRTTQEAAKSLEEVEDISGYHAYDSLQENLKEYFDFVHKFENDQGEDDVGVDYHGLFNFKNSNIDKYNDLRQSILKHLSLKNLKKLSQDQKLAFLINAYNFVAIDIIIQNSHDQLMSSIYQFKNTSSILNNNRKFGYLIGEERLSLNQIMNQKIRKITKHCDGRIILALVNSAQSSGLLYHKPYTADKLDKYLDRVVEQALDLSRFVIVDKERKLTINPLFGPLYYGRDFACAMGDPLAPATAQLAAETMAPDSAFIVKWFKKYLRSSRLTWDEKSFLDFNKSLNIKN